MSKINGLFIIKNMKNKGGQQIHYKGHQTVFNGVGKLLGPQSQESVVHFLWSLLIYYICQYISGTTVMYSLWNGNGDDGK